MMLHATDDFRMLFFFTAIAFLLAAIIFIINKNKNWQISLLITILAAFCFYIYPHNQKADQPVVPAVPQYSLEQQQLAFTKWYKSFEDILENSNKCWQEFTAATQNSDFVIEDFAEDVTATLQRLKANDEQLAKITLPPELSAEHHLLLRAVVNETQKLSSSRYVTLLKVQAFVSNQKDVPSDKNQDFVRELKKIVITNNIVYLNIAPQIIQIRNDLQIH